MRFALPNKATKYTTLQNLQEIFSLDQLHHKVEASIRLKRIIDFWQVFAPHSQEYTRFHQCLPTRCRSHIIGFFNSARAISFAGINTTVDCTKSAAIDQITNDILASNHRSRRKCYWQVHSRVLLPLPLGRITSTTISAIATHHNTFPNYIDVSNHLRYNVRHSYRAQASLG